MIIPHEHISSEALHNLVEEFITREGTDYGLQEISLKEKVDQVMHQIKRNEVLIVFDPKTESTSLVSAQQAKNLTESF